MVSRVQIYSLLFYTIGRWDPKKKFGFDGLASRTQIVWSIKTARGGDHIRSVFHILKVVK